jgi:hypothetical protein
MPAKLENQRIILRRHLKANRRLRRRKLVVETLETRALLTGSELSIDDLILMATTELGLTEESAVLTPVNVPEIELEIIEPGPIEEVRLEDILPNTYVNPWIDEEFDEEISYGDREISVGAGDDSTSWLIGTTIAVEPTGLNPSIAGPVDLDSDETVLADAYGPYNAGAVGLPGATSIDQQDQQDQVQLVRNRFASRFKEIWLVLKVPQTISWFPHRDPCHNPSRSR